MSAFPVIRTWAGRPATDLILVVPLAAAFTFSVACNPPGDEALRSIFLQSAAGMSVGAVAFALTGASIIFSVTPGERLRNVLRTAGYQFAKIITSSVITLILIATALSFAIVLEDRNPPIYLIPMELTLTAYAALVQLRLAWLLSQVLTLLALER